MTKIQTREKQNRRSKSRQSLWRCLNWNWPQATSFISQRFPLFHEKANYFCGATYAPL